MNRKIFTLSFLASLAAAVLALGLAAGILYPVLIRQSQRDLEKHLLILSQGMQYKGRNFLEDLPDLNLHLILTDPSGIVLYDSRDWEAVGTDLKDRPTIAGAIESGSGSGAHRSSYHRLSQRLAYAVRLQNGRILEGTVRQDTVPRMLLRLLPAFLLALPVVILLSFLLSRQVTKRILLPLEGLDLEHPLENETYEELRPLLERIGEQNQALKERLQQELKEQEDRHNGFAASLSHELKTPLTTISGFAELIQEGGLPEERLREAASSIRQEAGRLLSLSDELIALLQAEEQENAFAWEDLDLKELAEEAASRLGPSARHRRIRLSVEGPSVTVRGVRPLLSGMVYNLCDNAVKYGREGGSVRLRLMEHTLQVEDDGIGIPEEDKERIFERFYRVDKSRSRKAGGSGLGLSIVRQGARIHHAELSLKSRLGEGTTVTLRFP